MRMCFGRLQEQNVWTHCTNLEFRATIFLESVGEIKNYSKSSSAILLDSPNAKDPVWSILAFGGKLYTPKEEVFEIFILF